MPRRVKARIAVVLGLIGCAGVLACNAGPTTCSEKADPGDFVAFSEKERTLTDWNVPVRPPVSQFPVPRESPILSDNPGIVTVDAEGMLVAHENGVATLRLGRSSLIVHVRRTNGVRITPERSALKVGNTVALSLIGDDAEPLASASARWSIGNPAVAMLSPEGLLVARRPGRTAVLAEYGQVTARAMIDVLPDATRDFRLSPAQPRVTSGSLITLQALSSGGPLPATWSSSAPAAAATLGDGVFRAIRPGTAEVCASAGGRKSCTTVGVVR